MFKENITKETFDSDKEFAMTIQEIEKSQHKKLQEEQIFFQHPLKTVDATMNHIQGRGFRHLHEEQQTKSQQKNIIQELSVTQTELVNPLLSKDDAPTLKEIESHMGKLNLQK